MSIGAQLRLTAVLTRDPKNITEGFLNCLSKALTENSAQCEIRQEAGGP
jgi:hypothetical protein